MNPTIQTLMNHVSVRDFEATPLTAKETSQLVAAAQMASTSSYQQAYSIIGVTTPALKAKIAKLAGDQPFVAGGESLFIFCADQYRNHQLAEQSGVDVADALAGSDAMIVATVDAALAAQNMVIAAESKGLGACYVGGIRDGISAISELLELPKGVYPVFGLVIGHPKTRNAPKPRLPQAAVYHENHYQADKLSLVNDYDRATAAYYDQRSGHPVNRSWSKTALNSYVAHPRQHMRDYLHHQGFMTR
ncbi:oxygen-insensitive NADPH nitroreductase [Lactiplantibacillus plajomi]|uniref:Oxygen-insensitive NADPH nitroreductase n=1 Tax=Lactiplantibacillus plajomi TaxID=1457217 RepID=A0ABV6K1D5_9LACO|nr:oxygen-insensitive NADPH nitroreductase [Lactiplantibacillus plajomi]